MPYFLKIISQTYSFLSGENVKIIKTNGSLKIFRHLLEEEASREINQTKETIISLESHWQNLIKKLID